MKTPVITILLVFALSCSTPTDQTISTPLPFDSIGQIEAGKAEVVRELMKTFKGQREYSDSGRFQIIKARYSSGAPYFNSYTDTSSKLESWIEYYEFKGVKEFGTMTAVHHLKVGKWSYYSEEGKLDSIVDHDKKYGVSYFRALEMRGSMVSECRRSMFSCFRKTIRYSGRSTAGLKQAMEWVKMPKPC